MYIVDGAKLKEAIKAQGFQSIGEFADALGVHRNTIYHYLRGNRVFPDKLERMMTRLRLIPSELLRNKRDPLTDATATVAPLFDRLRSKYPEHIFVLFGSRVRGNARRYADWDIGIFNPKGLSHAEYRRIATVVDDMSDDLPYMIDLVNLNRADPAFLRTISRHWQLICGRWQDWVVLQKRAITSEDIDARRET